MSCSCFCCVTPSGELLHGIQKKEQLVVREEEEGEAIRSIMDLSLLREKYLSSREQQKLSQVILLRTVPEEHSEAVSFVPVTQGLSPPPVTSDPDPTTSFDPWHVHLELHRRNLRHVTTACSPETTSSNGSSRKPSSDSSSCCCTTEEEEEASGGFRGEEEVETESCPPASSPCSVTEVQRPRVLQRQLSVGSSSMGGPHEYHPFPSRKTPRISEAAKRLGLYASF
ncbi:uncharacterized protein LOC117475888 isoform X2 [Trematomus bernacchii]|uniref:uncharacterized protein LOC117475888 isoform X2 n=1 Tax=Trematomus bernacchii TaxID=40690 RepID=UPI00146DC0CC|nr:uncharacterized protein LOC117475888 isoform X2 [Trematomus bernacchii]